MSKSAVLHFDGKEITLPVIQGSEGELGIDISKLRQETGLVTYDPALGDTAICQSAITFIDGEKGVLRYRGIPIEQFEDRPDFVEVAWLIMFGRFPNSDESQRFRQGLTANAHLHESMKHHFEAFPTEAPPMAITSAMINALSCFHPELFELESVERFEEIAFMLMSKIRTVAAYTYRRVRGLPYIYPDPKLRYCANLLHMMFSMPYEQFIIDPEVENALNLVLSLHADHEQNCSTFTVRVVGSSKANLFASCAAGVCALWGPLHGGANVEVIEMLEHLRKEKIDPKSYLEQVKRKEGGTRLMGFGHRVYKNYDPRAKILKAACGRVLSKLPKNDHLLDIAMELEQLALADPYFVERKLYPNVDFYSGLIFRAVGIPTNMYTVMFTMGRLPGWMAHWREQHDDTSTRISRPRQIYMGPTESEGQALWKTRVPVSS